MPLLGTLLPGLVDRAELGDGIDGSRKSRSVDTVKIPSKLPHLRSAARLSVQCSSGACQSYHRETWPMSSALSSAKDVAVTDRPRSAASWRSLLDPVPHDHDRRGSEIASCLPSTPRATFSASLSGHRGSWSCAGCCDVRSACWLACRCPRALRARNMSVKCTPAVTFCDAKAPALREYDHRRYDDSSVGATHGQARTYATISTHQLCRAWVRQATASWIRGLAATLTRHIDSASPSPSPVADQAMFWTQGERHGHRQVLRAGQGMVKVQGTGKYLAADFASKRGYLGEYNTARP